MSEKLSFFSSVCNASAKSFSLQICTLHDGFHGGLGLCDIGVSAGSVTVRLSPGKPEGSKRIFGLRRVAILILADVAVGVPGTGSRIGEPRPDLSMSCHVAGVGLASGRGLFPQCQ